jgi:prevent-host-death family protein
MTSETSPIGALEANLVAMKTVTSTEAKAKLNALLAEVERTGEAVTITNHGRPVAVLSPAQQRSRRFGQLVALVVPDDFDAALPDAETSAWEASP